MIAPARLAAALAILALLLLPASPGGGAAVRAMGPLPPCRYDDLLTSPRGYGDWSVTLVDTILRVPKGYVPPDLVSVGKAGLTGSAKTIRAISVADLRAMVAAAEDAEAPIGVESAYRSYAEQEELYESWEPGADGDSSEAPARPGHSEHQLGLAIDFHSEAPDAKPGERFLTTPGGRWMAEHAWEFGWVMSYPDGEDGQTCYAFEPWHYRYAGREQAARIHASGMTLREFLWARSTTTVVPIPLGTGSLPAPTTPPTGTPSAAPATAPATAPAASEAAVPSHPAATAGTGPTDPPPIGPTTGAGGSIDAGTAVVVGALVILVASGAGIWAATRRGRPGPPGGRV